MVEGERQLRLALRLRHTAGTDIGVIMRLDSIQTSMVDSEIQRRHADLKSEMRALRRHIDQIDSLMEATPENMSSVVGHLANGSHALTRAAGAAATLQGLLTFEQIIER